MMNDPNPVIRRRRGFLAGSGVTLLRRLAAGNRINLNTFRARDGLSGCLLGHLAASPVLRADGWRFVNGVPCWAGRMGVAAASAYFGLDRARALDLFGNPRESRAPSLEARFLEMEAIIHCDMPNDVKRAI